ncbi:MAG: thymidine phosphorylase [Spirochaetales bacterium]|nr:thymidine phosphorylase [Spirochaetales bacterium]
MRAVDIIIKKRQGQELTREEVEFLVDGYIKQEIPDYQLAAFLMAVFFQGMSFQETGLLTRAMLNSGSLLDLTGIQGPFIDKHSTGGVGDKITLVLAPLAAACDLTVPMMCGRGLGHTGGTIDKLESIPGYRTQLKNLEIKKILAEAGYVIMSQTAELVPADRKMYALRDVTGTVESIPLITASILSKKCATGAAGFVFDVKCGSGAFMKDSAQAEELALSLVKTAASLERKALAVITDMNCPLGNTVGNMLEVLEAADCLRGKGPADVMEVTLRLTAHMLVLGGICSDVEQAEKLAARRIADGSALDKFLLNIQSQGGNAETVMNSAQYKSLCTETALLSPDKGYISKCDASKIGLAAVTIGAGRARKEDSVLPHVGIELKKTVGDPVEKGEKLLVLYTDGDRGKEQALKLLSGAYTFSIQRVERRSRILRELDHI